MALVFVLSLSSCGGGGEDRTPAAAAAPSFGAVDMETGETVTVPDDYRGRALVLLFFSPG